MVRNKVASDVVDQETTEHGEIRVPTDITPSAKSLMANNTMLDWQNNVYRGKDLPQLTIRSIVMGSFLGGIMALSNLYVGLKTGWGFNVGITACLLSFAINRGLASALPRYYRSEMNILESNCMQSTASSAGFSTGGTMTSAICAYLILTGGHIHWVVLTLWTFLLTLLGMSMAVPLKRQMINIEQLKFPSGIATAETLKSLYSTGAEGLYKARLLAFGGIIGGLMAWMRDGVVPSFIRVPAILNIPGSIGGYPLASWTISFEISPMMIASGAIIGWKIAWSLLLGALLNYAVIAPWIAQLGGIDLTCLGYRAIVSWSTWAGAALMVTSALLTFAFQWRSILRSFCGFSRVVNNKNHVSKDPLAAVEIPPKWCLIGMTAGGIGCVALLVLAFKTSVAFGLLALVITFLLTIVACRTTGESDITPVSAISKITQLVYGTLAPSNVVTNITTSSLTGSAALSASDLLTVLKTGFIVGGNPRKQFLAQFFGIFTGTAVLVPAFYILVPEPSVLGTAMWPAPGAQVWAAVASLLSNGLASLHPTAQTGLWIGGLVGITLSMLERLFPRHAWLVPSAMGIGLAMVIPFFNSLSIFIGALIALLIEMRSKKMADTYIIPVSSGLIAGESIMGIVIALLTASGVTNCVT